MTNRKRIESLRALTMGAFELLGDFLDDMEAKAEPEEAPPSAADMHAEQIALSAWRNGVRTAVAIVTRPPAEDEPRDHPAIAAKRKQIAREIMQELLPPEDVGRIAAETGQYIRAESSPTDFHDMHRAAEGWFQVKRGLNDEA